MSLTVSALIVGVSAFFFMFLAHYEYEKGKNPSGMIIFLMWAAFILGIFTNRA